MSKRHRREQPWADGPGTRPRSPRLTRREKRSLSNGGAVKAIRERRSGLPWQRACATVRQLVDAGELPLGCQRVIEAMARCHEEHGAGVRDRELLIGYGLRGDAKRVEARKRSRAEPPVYDGIAEEARLSRRYTIACVALMVGAEVLRRWYGGPKADYRENIHPVLQRADGAGERREHVHGLGGSGWANAYTVEGIPDPLPPEDRPPPPEPEPAPPSPQLEHAREKIREMREGLDRDRLDRQRQRLAREEAQRTNRGP